jgi:N-acetylglucosaminyldiphosphoundecaprenol N-acetyl-beta-D-mannosaminyltransferase
MKERLVTGQVLGCGLNIESYESATKLLVSMTQDGVPHLVAAANTHLVSEAHEDPEFGRVLERFDLVLPDGMPLVWALQLDGHVIRERVYGPYLMDYVIRHSPIELKHYFFGGTEQCLQSLRDQLVKWRPGLQIVGMVSPPFGEWDPLTENRLIQEINRSGADLIWVALGGVKQEKWLAAHQDELKAGVFLAVGDAFVLLAGLRTFAPAWMQRIGMTWLYRLAQEPKRLMGRYLKYNARFVISFMKERWVLAHGQRLRAKK